MVAVIKTSASLRNVLQYNENKLKQNAARLIYSNGFGKDTENLGFTDKLRTLEKLNSLNERTQLKTVHISLNFDPSERLDKETLSRIADSYMQKIGFGSQPYLVYEHYDAGHPHLHLVTTNIQRDGKRIKMQNIGKNQSEKARKEIEKEYKLIQAEGKQRIVYELKPVNAQKLQYGKTETKRAITNVLDRILPAYKYSSLPELNAILKAYNIVADRGSENSRIYKAGGLVYRVLDEKGQKVGTPIKASDFYNKPTLKFLEERFKQNEVEKQQFKQKLKHAIDLSFLMRRRQSIQELSLALSRQKIQLVLRQNEQGIIYGMTYIDHGTRCVFNGSDLGKEYSAKGIQERCNPDAISEQITLQPEAALKNVPASNQQVSKTLETSKSNDLIHQLTKTEYQEPLAIELKRKEYKKRKRKRLHL